MSVNTLHIEASSFCNARCPGCPRNAYGYPLEGFYDERNLKIDQLKEILSQFTDVYHILYCGNHVYNIHDVTHLSSMLVTHADVKRIMNWINSC